MSEWASAGVAGPSRSDAAARRSAGLVGVLLVAGIAGATGCGGAPSDGIVRYANGKPWAVAPLRGGRPHGEWSTWWSDGTPKSVEHWENGLLEGSFESWYENGRPLAKGEYRGSLRHGEWTVWYADGSPKLIENWNQGVLHGSSRGWYEDGKPAHVAEYVDGELVGVHEQWHPTGHRKATTVYRSKEPEDIFRQLWYEDGTPRFECRYVDGLMEGELRFWTEDGVLEPEMSGVYAKGKKIADLPSEESTSPDGDAE